MSSFMEEPSNLIIPLELSKVMIEKPEAYLNILDEPN